MGVQDEVDGAAAALLEEVVVEPGAVDADDTAGLLPAVAVAGGRR